MIVDDGLPPAERRRADRLAAGTGGSCIGGPPNGGKGSARGNPRGGAAELVAATAGARVLSLDAPSGLILSDGRVGEPAVEAEATLTLALPKAGLRAGAAGRLTGGICLADLGIPPAVFDRAAIPYRSPFSRGRWCGSSERRRARAARISRRTRCAGRSPRSRPPPRSRPGR